MMARGNIVAQLITRILSALRGGRSRARGRPDLERTVAELRESEARFREAFDHAPIGKGLLSLDGRFLKVNRALCEILGYTEPELLRRTFQDITHPADLDSDLAQMRRLASGEIQSYQLEKRYIRKDGGDVWVLVTGASVRDEAGKPLYTIAQVLDITERRAASERDRELARLQASTEQAEAAARRMEFLAGASSVLASSLDYEATLQSVSRLMVPELGDYCLLDIVDEDGRVRRVAAAHADPALEPVVQRARQYPPPRTARGHPVIRALDTGRTILLEHPDRTPIGVGGPEHAEVIRQLAPRSLISVPLVAAGHLFGALTTVLDERSSRTFGPTEVALAEEIARRAAVAVDNARNYRKAEEANRAKSDFLAVMSHELRTPLNSVVGYTDLLSARVPGPLTELQAEYLDRIRRSASHLLSLIEEVLTYSRLEAGRETVRREMVQLDELVRSCATLVEPLALERGLAFEVHVPDLPVRMETDARKVRQMLTNLLSNAVKFTESGAVVLTATASGDEVRLTVRDSGIGIAPEHLEKVFEPFWQADSGTTRRANGTGLGLGVTRRLARLLGGDVTVESAVGRGSTFRLCLPRRVGPRAAAGGSAAAD